MADEVDVDGASPRQPYRPYYDRDFVETEFTPDKIAEQGKYLLFRALNVGRAIGFIGSGVPAAFGRPTWRTLIEEITDSVHARPNLLASVRETSELLGQAAVGGISDPDLLPLRAHLLKTLNSSTPDHLEGPGDSEDFVAQRIKEQTQNDDSVAKAAWQAFFQEPCYRKPSENWLAPPAGSDADAWNPERWDSREWRRLDRVGVLNAVAASPPGDVSAEAASSPRLSAEQRSIVPLLAALNFLRPEEERRQLARRLAKYVLGSHASDADADAERPDALNPIELLLDKLQITRLLTTNYDFELERGLERLGFGRMRPLDPAPNRPTSAGRSTYIAHRPRGDAARSTVFKHETAADLIDFAVHGSDFDYEIFHLHGRAGPGDPLVITERDYQAAYMRDTPEGHAMREALQVAFGGNPIVFIGMGMLEADVLRPLRRFVSDPTGRVNRSIIALLPTEETKARRTATALQLYLRYGVHVVFFGEREGLSASGAPGEPTKRSPDETKFWPAPWLDKFENDDARLYRAIRRIREAVDGLGGGPSSPMLNWLAGKTDPRTGKPCVDVLLEPIREMLEHREPDTRSHPKQNDLLIGAYRLLASLLSDDDVLDALMKPAPTFPAPNSEVPEELVGPGHADAARRQITQFLWNLDSRLRTRALCTALEQLSVRRTDWWRQWRRLPVSRRFSHLVETAKPGGWTRAEDDGRAWLTQHPDTPFRVVRFGVAEAWTYRRPPGEFDEHDDESQDEDPVANLGDQILGAREGARIRIVRGDPGAGRGTLFHYLSDHFADRQNGTGEGYDWGVFINAAFSIEYSSVIDGAIDFFWRCSEGRTDRWARGARKTRRPRREAIDYFIDKLPRDKARRGIVVITSFEFMFRGNGTAKNHDIADAIDRLISKAAEANYDVVLICRRDRCHSIFAPLVDLKIRDETERQRVTDAATAFWSMPIPATASKTPRTAPAFRLGSDEPTETSTAATAHQALVFDLPRGELYTRTRWALDHVIATDMGDRGLAARRLLKQLREDRGKFLDVEALERIVSGRFQASVVVACVLETYVQKVDAPVAEVTDDDPRHRVATEAVGTFLNSLADASARTSDAGRSPDLVISGALRQYVRLGEIRCAPGGRKGGKSWVCPALCETVLKHLAVMSSPVEATVLLRCPEIRDRLAERYDASDELDGKTWDQLDENTQLQWLIPVLARLRQRRLIFQMKSREDVEVRKAQEPSISLYTRFAAHQSLQSYFFRQIGSPHLVFGDSRLFTVSLFASQSAELPTPTEEGYGFMMRLIENLAMHPRSDAARRRALNPQPPSEDQRMKDVCALRAAVSLTRSAFSLGVISRMAEIAPQSEGANDFGYLERYRLLVRWMIYQAGDLGDQEVESNAERARFGTELAARFGGVLKRAALPIAKTLKERIDLAYRKVRTNALYQDEITWLYNECGLASYAQGNLYDAIPLFEQARTSNRKVEIKSDVTPNALRIRLNLAMAQIERGNLSRANSELNAIIAASDREPVVRAIAIGYRGLVAHLRGRFRKAQDRYAEAIKLLRQLRGEARALSIFHRHFAAMLRNQNQRNPAQEHLRAAMAEAETAGQQDQVQRTRVSQAVFELSDVNPGPDVLRRVLRQLRTVERYADVMEVHSLKVDVLTARARVFEMQGETRMSGENAIEALALATLHGMKLRVMSALAMIGKITQERGYLSQAHQISTTARRMAERAGYQLSVARADRVLVETADPGAGLISRARPSPSARSS